MSFFGINTQKLKKTLLKISGMEKIYNFIYSHVCVRLAFVFRKIRERWGKNNHWTLCKRQTKTSSGQVSDTWHVTRIQKHKFSGWFHTVATSYRYMSILYDWKGLGVKCGNRARLSNLPPFTPLFWYMKELVSYDSSRAQTAIIELAIYKCCNNMSSYSWADSDR